MMDYHGPQKPLATPSNLTENRSPSRIDDELGDYTLTIGEASSLMIRERCKFASNRKVQRMCRDGVIDCHKLQTTRNGQPVSEWLVNEASLLKHINKNEIKWDEGAEVFPAASGNATVKIGNANLPPIGTGDASQAPEPEEDVANAGDAVAMPDNVGDTGGVTQNDKSVENKGDAVATQNANGGANNLAEAIVWDRVGGEVGEKRSFASILIENAKLTAQLEGAHNLISEVQDDREFLRDELKEARSGRKDVTAIAERMLETLESIAIGGKLMPSPRSQQARDHRTEYQNGRSDPVQSDTHDPVEVPGANTTTHPIETEDMHDGEGQPPWHSSPDISDPQNPFRI